MKSLILIVAVFAASLSLAYDEHPGHVDSCFTALEEAQRQCFVGDDYDWEHSYDMDCFASTMESWGYSMDDLVLDYPEEEHRPFYNEYRCLEDLYDY